MGLPQKCWMLHGKNINNMDENRCETPMTSESSISRNLFKQPFSNCNWAPSVTAMRLKNAPSSTKQISPVLKECTTKGSTSVGINVNSQPRDSKIGWFRNLPHVTMKSAIACTALQLWVSSIPVFGGRSLFHWRKWGLKQTMSFKIFGHCMEQGSMVTNCSSPVTRG